MTPFTVALLPFTTYILPPLFLFLSLIFHFLPFLWVASALFFFLHLLLQLFFNFPPYYTAFKIFISTPTSNCRATECFLCNTALCRLWVSHVTDWVLVWWHSTVDGWCTRHWFSCSSSTSSFFLWAMFTPRVIYHRATVLIHSDTNERCV